MSYPSSKQVGYEDLRAAVSSADSDLTSTTKKWSTFASSYHPESSTPKAVKLPDMCHNISIIFDFATANTDTAALTLYAYREKGPAEFVCSIDTITAGAQANNDSTTRYYVDTIGTITQRWHGGTSAVSEVDSGGNDGVAKLTFNTYGVKYLLCLFTTIGSGSVRAKYAYTSINA